MSLAPRWFSRKPRRRASETAIPDFLSLGNFGDIENFPSGLSVSADEKNIYVEAQVPGLTSKDVEVSIDKNHTLWIKGFKKEESEDRKKKFYRRSQSAFSYCLPLWEEIDEEEDPEASCKDGVMVISFCKKSEKKSQAKKIKVKG